MQEEDEGGEQMGRSGVRRPRLGHGLADFRHHGGLFVSGEKNTNGVSDQLNVESFAGGRRRRINQGRARGRCARGSRGRVDAEKEREN